MKKTFSRFGIASLVAVFAASTLVATPAYAADCDASLFAGGLGTEGSPFQISTAAQLANIQECRFEVKNYVMTSNISVASISPWVAISNFIGNFDGANHEITNLNLSSAQSTGIFGQTEYATIKNLKVSGTAIVNPDIMTFGVVAARAVRTVIDNIDVKVDVDVPASVLISGGVVGYSDYATISNVKFTSQNSAWRTVAHGNSFGGIVGYLFNGSLSQAEVVTDVESGAESDQTGGVAGYVSTSSLADLSMTGNITGGGWFMGGIVAYLSDSTLDRATHTGEINNMSTEAGSNLGGILGYTSESHMTSLHQIGNVYSTVADSQGFTGGITSYLAGESSLTNATVVGDITGTDHVGGIVGFLSTKSPVSNVVITGNVVGKDFVGGIVGYQNSDISNATFTGDISSQSNAGGISGYCAGAFGMDENFNFVTTPSNISNVVVTADVVITGDEGSSDFAWAPAGTITGYSSSCNLTNAVTTGSVTGKTFAGGVIGYSSGSTLSSIKSNVTVVSTGENVGGLVGYASDLTINDASATGDVTGSADFFGPVGGLLGYASGIIANRIAYSGNVIGVKSVGGFFGRASDVTVTDGYVSGKVKHDPTAEYAAAGHISGNASGVTLTRVYVSSEGADDYDLSLFGQGEAVMTSVIQDSTADDTVGEFTSTLVRTSAQMKIAKTFRDESWDFATVWMMNAPANNGMPMLRSLSVPSDCKVRNFSPVLFKKGSATLSGKAKTNLRKFVSQVGFGPCSALRITGYTSTVEIGKKVTPVSKLKKLAAKRAQAVKKYLNAQFLNLGDSFTVTIVNRHKKSPIASNKKPAGQAKNRRVVVRVLS